ncbi:hypothetical protein [Persephonella sp.]
MGLYDRDYMRERSRSSIPSGGGNNTKLIITAVISFILGYIVGKII